MKDSPVGSLDGAADFPSLLSRPSLSVGKRGASSLVRRKAAVLYEQCVYNMAELLARHNVAVEARSRGLEFVAKDVLSVSELAKISSEVKSIGVGELRDVSIESSEVVDCLAEVLSSSGISFEVCEHVLSELKARLRDV